MTTQYALLLAESLVNPSGKEISPDKAFWNEQARDLIVAATMHVLDREDSASLPDVADLLLRGDLLKILRTSSSQYAQETAESFGKFAEETRGSIFANAVKAINLFRLETIRALTRTNSFSVDDFENGLSLYLTIPINQLKALKSFSRLIVTILIQRLLEDDTRKKRILFAIDEFPVFERFDYLTEALGYMRSYGIKVLIAVQGLNNLENFYGPNQTVEMNCGTQLIYPPADRKTAAYLSQTLGDQTIDTLSEGRSRGLRNLRSNASSSETGRKLLMPDELRFDLQRNDALLLVPGFRPVKVRAIPYFKDTLLLRRSMMPPRPGKSAMPGHDLRALAGEITY